MVTNYRESNNCYIAQEYKNMNEVRWAIKAEWHTIKTLTTLALEDPHNAHKYMQPNIDDIHDITIEGEWLDKGQPFWVFYIYYNEFYSSDREFMFDDVDDDYLKKMDAIAYAPITFFLCEAQTIIETKREKGSLLNYFNRLNVKILDTLILADFLQYSPHKPYFCNFKDIFTHEDSYYDVEKEFLHISYYCQGYAYEYCIKINEHSITVMYEYEYRNYYLHRDDCFITNYEMELTKEIVDWWITKELIYLKDNKMYLLEKDLLL